MAPFTAIFEGDLKPKLELLPTRAQRELRSKSKTEPANP
jgi:hypothetical protein